MQSYSHLSLQEREQLFAWKESGTSLRGIAKRLGRNVGTISREWKRHTKYGKTYLPCLAQQRADRIATKQRYHAPLKEPLIFLYVREHLREPYHWSPETIAGRLGREHPGSSVDPETIYRYIYGKKQRRMKLWRYLRRHRKRRMKKDGRKVQQYARLATAIPISIRPGLIHERKRLGDWESDNMEGKRSDTTGISVSVDRLSRVVRLRKLTDHRSPTKADALLDQWTDDVVHSVTVDRGSENSDHERLTNTRQIAVYACAPYHSWEKGTVENTVGRVRWYIPKGESVDPITQEDLTVIEDQMNNTPRKCLGFLTPNEFLEKIHPASPTL